MVFFANVLYYIYAEIMGGSEKFHADIIERWSLRKFGRWELTGF